MARLILVTGMAGAGRTTALKALEDLGCEAVDNLPISLLPRLVRPDDKPKRDLAIGVDSRTRAFSPEGLQRRLAGLRQHGDMTVQLLFLDCEDEVLQRRFTETRRRHPLAADRPVTDGIAQERAVLAPLRDVADLVIDTSRLSPHELKRLIGEHLNVRPEATLILSVVSFAYRHGLPREADLVFDVRFLGNPHYVAELRPLTGVDARVRDHVQGDPGYRPLLNDIERLLLPLLPAFEREGKSYLTVAIGCTGGKHRSVVAAEDLAARLRATGRAVVLRHRDAPPPAGVGPLLADVGA